MLRIFILLISALFVIPFSYSQKVANNFIDALINNTENISDFVDADERKRSKCFGINYTGIENKWLISFDIPDEIKQGFREGKFNYTLQTQQLENGFSVVTLAVGSPLYLQKFYFLNDKFVPPSRYFTTNWEDKRSKYFIFRISEPKYFNDYCIKRLDDFVDSLCTLLEIEPERKKLLEKEKIYYTFCVDENEVEKITGYKSKGMSVLAYDEVITAYQTHFHEVAHLLINYKLQNLGLFTLPFFLEGFAVAVGGRGGMAPRVVTDLGYYLQKTGFMTYDSLLTYESFYLQDPNMTYAISGLYNRFLIDELGGRKYLEMYKSFNGDLNFVSNIASGDVLLHPVQVFHNYLKKYDADRNLIIYDPDWINSDTIKGVWNTEIGDYYAVRWCDHTDITIDNIIHTNYMSRKYSELFPGETYRNEKYSIITDSRKSIKIFNLFNDELIASYDENFSPGNKEYYRYFLVRKDLFRFSGSKNVTWKVCSTN